MIYICIKFRESILNGLRVMKSSILIITKVHNAVYIARRVIVFVFCTSSFHGLHLSKVRKNILNGLKVMERTQFQDLYLQRGIIP